MCLPCINNDADDDDDDDFASGTPPPPRPTLHHHHQSLFIHEIVSFYMVFLVLHGLPRNRV